MHDMRSDEDDARIAERAISFTAADGHQLSGLLFRPEAPRAGALVSPATGYPKEFYRRFARAGAERGAAVLVYDYRGIGGSAPETLKGFKADVVDWGRRDMEAAIAALDAEIPGLAMASVGHSVGGHLIGFARSHARFARHAFVSVGSGYWGRHKPAMWPFELFFWWAYGPATLAAKGYLPGGGLWGGTALPKGAFQQWRRWSSHAAYLGRDLDGLGETWFDAATAPIRSYVFADDPIATPGAAQDILDLYANAPREMAVRGPADYAIKRIGHDGAFRRAASALWAEVWDWTLECGAA